MIASMKAPEELALMVFFLMFLAVAHVVNSAAADQEKSIFLVLMEGEAAAFHGITSSISDTKAAKFHDPNSALSKSHAKYIVESHDQLLQQTLDNETYHKLYSFKHVVNGFALHATPSQAEKLKAVKGVKVVEKDRGVKLMTTYTPQFLSLPNGVWKQQGGKRGAGKGVIVGIVDTGIDPKNPSFRNLLKPKQPAASTVSNCSSSRLRKKPEFTNNCNVSRFMGACETGPHFPASSCNGKIVSARFFSKGARAVAELNTSVDFLSPFDAEGHGSHVASVAAGNAKVPVVVNGYLYGMASGIAPGASIAVYKAIYPTVSTLTDVIAAIDQAVHDGVDILALSVGPDAPPEDVPTVLSAFDLVLLSARRAGVFVAQAAGNGGPTPASVLSFSPWVVGVAASSTDRTYPGSLTLGDGQTVSGIGLSGPTLGSGLFVYRLVLAKDALKQKATFPRTAPYVEECQVPEAFDPLLVRGSIVICTFSSGFLNQTSNIPNILHTASALGFVGFLFVANPKYGDFIAEPIPFSGPGVMIPKVADAQIVLKYYEERTSRDEKGLVTNFGGRASIGEGRAASFCSRNSRAPTVSRFSARGPNFINLKNNTSLDVLKPDLLAPGHQIWAAWSPMSVSEPILQGQSFALLSGTSMATPHVVGAAALIKQRNPTWTPSMIASAMSTTATTYDNFGDVIMAEGSDLTLAPSTPFDFGAGHISPTRATDPGLVFPSEYRDYITFLCSLPEIQPQLVQAASGEPCTRTFARPSDLNLPSITLSSLKGSVTVHRTVQNVGTIKETYSGSVLSPNGTTVTLNPTWFTIYPQEKRDLNIQINVTQATRAFSFGQIVWTGNLDHIVRIPLSVRAVSVT